MRDIKFRWWVTGGGPFDDKYYDEDGNVIPHMETDLACEEYLPINDEINVRDTIVMQYTGVKDKNGREIYEGDVVHFKCSGLSGKGYVYWDGKTAQFKILDIRERTKGRSYPFYEDATYRVDGNCYENLSLPKEDEVE